MKKRLLFVILISCAVSVFGQNCNDQLDVAKKAYYLPYQKMYDSLSRNNTADDYLEMFFGGGSNIEKDTKSTFEGLKECVRQFEKLYTTVDKSNCKNYCTYIISKACGYMGWMGLDPPFMDYVKAEDALPYVMKALEYRKAKNDPPMSSTVSGITEEQYFQGYYDLIYLAAELNHMVKNKQKCLSYGWQYLGIMKDRFGDDFVYDVFASEKKEYEKVRLIYLTEDMSKDETDKSKQPELAVLRYEVAALDKYYYEKSDKKDDLTKAEKDLAAANADLSVFSYIGLGGADRTAALSMRMAKVKTAIGERAEGIKYYGYAMDAPELSLSDAWKLCDTLSNYLITNSSLPSEKSATLKSALEKGVDKIMATNPTYISDLEKLKRYYETAGKTDRVSEIDKKIRDIKKKQKRDNVRNNLFVGAGTAFLKLPFYSKYKQIPLSLIVMTGQLAHTFRLNLYDQYEDKKRLGAMISDEVTGERNPMIYSGWEGSYFLGFPVKGKDKIASHVGLEFRLGKYNQFNASTLYLTDLEYPYGVKDSVTTPIVCTRKDLNLVYRLLFGGKLLYGEVWMSWGFGWRNLNFTYDDSRYAISDYRFGADRFPMFTMPLRIGIRAGIRFF